MASDEDDKAPLPEDSTDIFLRPQPEDDQPTEEAPRPASLAHLILRALCAWLSAAAFDKEHFALTLNLPPAEARSPEARGMPESASVPRPLLLPGGDQPGQERRGATRAWPCAKCAPLLSGPRDSRAWHPPRRMANSRRERLRTHVVARWKSSA